MKRVFARKTSIFIALAIVFVIGQVMGTVWIRSMFISYKIDELSPIVRNIAGQIAAGGYVEPFGKDFILKAYGVDGQELDLAGGMSQKGVVPQIGIVSQNGNVPNIKVVPGVEIDEALKALIPKVISGEGVATLKRIGNQPSQSIVIGSSIVKDGNVIGAAFLLKPASDFSAVLNGFYLVFSLTLIAGTGFIGVFLFLYLKEMKELEQTRRDYVANVSHELKSPLASIRALSETLVDGLVSDDETQQRYHSMILHETGTLQRLIEDMLELSRLQSGKGAFAKEIIDGNAYFESLEEKYAPLLDEMGIRFEVNPMKMKLPQLYSNALRLDQLMTILITNAVKAVGEDGHITVDVEILKDHVLVTVSDNGVGMDSSEIKHIFDRFHRGKGADGHEGSGLGLAIAKALADGLGERLEVQSTLGVGSTFSFSVARDL